MFILSQCAQMSYTKNYFSEDRHKFYGDISISKGLSSNEMIFFFQNLMYIKMLLKVFTIKLL